MKIEFLTYKKLSDYVIEQLIKDKPSCWNGNVSVEQYKIIIERVDEPKKVYAERLQKLWDESTNHYHWEPLRKKAHELGVDLQGSPGSKKER